jgi:subtilisin family serine protease
LWVTENKKDESANVMNGFEFEIKMQGIVIRMIAIMMFLCLFMVSRQVNAQESPPHWLGSAKVTVMDAKITNPATAMEAFERGNGKGEFIVNLKTSSGGKEAGESLQSQEQKEERRTAVNTARNRAFSVMPGFPMTAVRYRYDNIFSFSVEVTPEELKLLLANPEIQTIEPVIILHAHLAQGIPLEKADTYRSQYNGQGLSVAICDTGIDYNNAYLGGGGFPNTKVIGGYDFGEMDKDPMDGNGHGTACAGIVAGALPTSTSGDYIGGVAYNAKLYALKISSTATNSSASNAAMVAAWDWCVTHQNINPNYPIMIISTSFGGGKHTSTCDTESPAMTNAAIAAKAAGITLFASSGNDGYCNAISWPACITHVMSVGAVYDAAFGTYYPCISGDSCAPSKLATTGCPSGWYATDNTSADMVTSYSNSASFLDLYAPANRAYTLGIGGSTFDTDFGGTSAACPYAAGAAAALQSAAKEKTGSWLTPDQVKTLLVDTGNSITDAKNGMTKPRVNLATAITYVQPSLLGSLTVTISMISPQGTVDAGGQWRRVGTTPWFNGGFTETGIPAGSYTVEFKPVTGWTTPSSVGVTISNGVTTTASGTYVRELIPIIQVTPMSTSFGYVPVGSTKDRFLTVKNLGGWFYLTGNATTTSPFSIFQGGYYNLGPDESHIITVRYQPTSEGPHTGTVVFTGGGDATVQVTGKTEKPLGLPWLMLLLD